MLYVRRPKQYIFGQLESGNVYLIWFIPSYCKCGTELLVPEEIYYCNIEEAPLCWECAVKDEVFHEPGICRWCSARGWW